MWLLVSPLSVSIFISKPGCQLAGLHSLVLSQRLVGGWPTLCQQGFYFLQMDLCGMESALRLQAIFRSTEPFQVSLHLFHTCAQASSSRDAWEAWATRVSAAHVRSLWSVWGRLIRDLTDHLWLFSPSGIPCQVTRVGTILLLTPKRPQTCSWWGHLLSLFTCTKSTALTTLEQREPPLALEVTPLVFMACPALDQLPHPQSWGWVEEGWKLP